MAFFKIRKGEEISAVASVSFDGNIAVLHLSGDWTIQNKHTGFRRIEIAIAEAKEKIDYLKFDISKLGLFDSSLICFLMHCHDLCSEKNISVDMGSLPKGPRELLKLAVAVPESEASKKAEKTRNYLKRIGEHAIGVLDNLKDEAEFAGELTIASVNAAKRRARFRMTDLLLIMQKSGPEALSIVALISFLVGLILAFVGVVQLAKYGSEIFVADLVGIAMVREMGAMMVGIVMSGRTGAAFAAELGSMKVNEEISAFRTFGISPMEFLVYPRVVALVLMFPLLTIFADVIGMMGGMAIGVGMSDVTLEQYLNRTCAALDITNCMTGVLKSFFFGIIVACIGCMRGLRCESSSAGVGNATTLSVVQSITWIIVADALFAVAFNIFDI